MEGGAGIAIFTELGRVKELMRQLESHLYHPSGIEHFNSLAPMIHSSLDRAMYMAISKGGRSPQGEGSSQPFKSQERRETPKKRKTLPRCTNQVRAGSGEGMERSLDDGHSWRKYGQKDILGARYPRAYYRCTHQKTRNCPAIKQVQRSDENPSVYDVTYRGSHACHQTPQPVVSLQESEQRKLDDHVHQQMLLAFGTELRVKTDRQGIVEDTSTSFSFPSTPCEMTGYGEGLSLQGGEPEFAESFSAVTSAATSPMIDMDFMVEQLELDQDFSRFWWQD